MAQCMTPYTLKSGETVPCGKCPNCYKRRVSGWSFRLMQEEKISKSAHFLTLTYDTQHVDFTPKGYMNLSKRHLQLFFKRLRKLNKNEKLKYYACGEYGGKTMRPHYHLILFNADMATIAPAWEMGHVHYGMVAEASVGYTLKYMSKTSRIPLHKNDDRQSEFALMSKGLGKHYLNDETERWHKDTTGLDKKGAMLNTERMYLPIEDGKKISMPRYYKNKLWSPVERQYIGKKTLEKMDNIKDKQINDDPMYYVKQQQSINAAFRKMDKDHKSRDNF